MHHRTLTSIGCNAHESVSVPDLGSAERDANNVFSTLVESSIGDYDLENSVLMTSPTLEEVRAELRSLASDAQSLEVLTFYFAGHGGIHQGNLYLYVKDTEPSALSVSAFSLSDLLRLVADQGIPHTNVILDACQAGGLWSEIAPLLNSEAIGARQTPSVSLLAMAASNEYAGEDELGGFGTQAFLNCLTGDTVCNTESPTLDLMEIGRAVSASFEGAAQMPVRWGLNLTGVSTFCYNPSYAGEASKVTPVRLNIGSSGSSAALQPFQTELWSAYLSLENTWDGRSFYNLLDSVLAEVSKSGELQPGAIESLAQSFSEQAKNNPDKSVASGVLASCGLALLKHSSTCENIEYACDRLFRQALDWAFENLTKLTTELDKSVYGLLSRQGGPFDFFYLPIRISRVLGWAAAIALCAKDSDRAASVELLGRLSDFVLEKYPSNLIAISDVQSAPLALFGAALLENEDQARLESVLSYYLHSLSLNAGMLASSTIPADRIFEYLIDRQSFNLEPGSDLIAQPSEFIAVCVRLSSLTELSEVMDDMMEDLDHAWLNAYVQSGFRYSGDDQLTGGYNITFRIGHDFWRVSEFEELWPNELIEQPASETEFLGAVLASLIFDDRVCWFTINK